MSQVSLLHCPQVGVLENAIMEKKRQVERLVQEMKEANLQSLTGSVDELRHPLDGVYVFLTNNNS